jgi:hypothetical protein
MPVSPDANDDIVLATAARGRSECDREDVLACVDALRVDLELGLQRHACRPCVGK